jgi:hypothetical protein
MKNLSDHIHVPCELLTSWMLRGVQMGKLSKLDWLIGLIMHARCYLPLLSISHIQASSQPTLRPYL